MAFILVALFLCHAGVGAALKVRMLASVCNNWPECVHVECVQLLVAVIMWCYVLPAELMLYTTNNDTHNSIQRCADTCQTFPVL